MTRSFERLVEPQIQKALAEGLDEVEHRMAASRALVSQEGVMLAGKVVVCLD